MELAPGNPGCSQRWEHRVLDFCAPRLGSEAYGRLDLTDTSPRRTTAQHTLKTPLVFLAFLTSSRVLRLTGVYAYTPIPPPRWQTNDEFAVRPSVR
eukprot:7768949-Pyramimonas_sp.AAC.2